MGSSELFLDRDNERARGRKSAGDTHKGGAQTYTHRGGRTTRGRDKEYRFPLLRPFLPTLTHAGDPDKTAASDHTKAKEGLAKLSGSSSTGENDRAVS